MPRLQDPDSKVVVRVDDEYGALLMNLGWTDPDAKPARKSATKPE